MGMYQANRDFQDREASYSVHVTARNINDVYLVHTATSVKTACVRQGPYKCLANAAAFLFHRQLIQCIHYKAI